MRPSVIAATSKRISSAAASGCAWSQEPAARRTRRRFAVDGSDGAAVRRRRALLDLDEHQPIAAARDQVGFVASEPDVRADDPVATQPVVPGGDPLAAVHEARDST